MSVGIRRSRSSHHHNHKSDPHKKLDRSYSEPVEKQQKNVLSASAQQQQQQQQQTSSSRYKTELCRSYAEVGHCKYGDKCQFAHGDEELRTITRHPKFKTENCKSFHSTGFCPYGPRCHFIHNSDESKKSLAQASNNTRLFDPLPIGNMIANHQQLVQSHSSGPSIGLSSLISNQLSPFASNNNTNVNGNLVRPKALSLGSYSLGSSGEISSPSSQSGSPTSLNSFFSEETAFSLNTLHGMNSHSKMSSYNINNNNNNYSKTFSFSPDSAFEAFNPNNNHHHKHQNVATNTNNVNVNFVNGNGGCNSNFSSPEPFSSITTNNNNNNNIGIDQTTNSVISQLFGSGGGSGSCGSSPTSFIDHSLFDEMIGMQTTTTMFSDQKSSILVGDQQQHQQQQQHLLFYPSSPESPVDSVSSEIEALKLGELLPSSPLLQRQNKQQQPPPLTSSTMIDFSPISSSFSTPSSMSTVSSSSSSSSNSSPPNSSGYGGNGSFDTFTFITNGLTGSTQSSNITSLNHHQQQQQTSGIICGNNNPSSGSVSTSIPRLPTFTKIVSATNNK
ncbi:hypothetical protein BLA29_001510 [Euroglyphus maynei]|uniref:C3H1-type domain-containing protein n=1 Tax=Euroglyphus maynei TaxID=6958 RepID=A0A1Y3BI98_EURMA|nr:hypothetical protein BLA29_001510 [Euroglyphus maynei]